MNVIRWQNNPESRNRSPFDHTKRIGRYMGIDKQTGHTLILTDDVFLDEVINILDKK